MGFSLLDCKNTLIFGAGHGIGLAIVQELLTNYKTDVIATYRIESAAKDLLELQNKYSTRLHTIQIDPTNEQQVLDVVNNLTSKNIKLDLIINSVGILHSDHFGPEKSLRTFDPDIFQEVLKVNTIPTALIAKHFERLLSKKEASAFVAISAKVGSIEDNKMGGWYSYRASKAALNMMVKNISIEFERKNKCLVLAIHPGTTKTRLSSPFTASTNYILHEPIDTAKNILCVIDGKDHKDTGTFYSWDGKELPW